MTIFGRIAAACAGLGVLSSILACGAVTKVNQAKQRVQAGNDLKQIAIAYMDFLEEKKGKPPTSANELAQWAQSKPDRAGAVPVINQAGPGGKYVIYWDVQVFKLAQGASNTVLGYESKVPAEGGMVLMADGSVMQRTAAEFAGLSKPAKDGDKK